VKITKKEGEEENHNIAGVSEGGHRWKAVEKRSIG